MPSPHRICSARPSLTWLLILPLFVGWLLFFKHYVLSFALPLDSSDELPPYSLSLSSQRVKTSPLDSDSVLSLRHDEKLSILLRPGQPVHAPLALRAFKGRHGRVERWGAPFVTLNNGGFLLDARPEDLPDLSPGEWEMIFLIGRPDKLPSNPYELPAARGGNGWQMLRFRLNVDGPLDPAPHL